MSFFKVKPVILSLMVTALCLIGLGGFAYVKKQEFFQINASVAHTHDVIAETLRLVGGSKALIVEQRGYLLTHEKEYLDRFAVRKADISDRLAQLREKFSDNPSQLSRLEEFQHNFLSLVDRLEARAAQQDPITGESVLITTAKTNIETITNAILEEEYALLSQRIAKAKRAQDNLLLSIMMGMILTGLLITTLNYYLMQLKLENREIGSDLTHTEERLKYALAASQEGVFDWNVETGYVIYSGLYASMLGRDLNTLKPTLDSAVELLHKDDEARVMDVAKRYINNELSEFSVQFRMLHVDGHYIWINSRGMAIRDENGKAIRIIGTHRDITDYKLNEQNLEAEIEEAEEATKAKSEFLAHMSHEIRTPLTAISGIAEILNKNSDEFDERQQQLIRTLSASTISLKDLVNDILDFSKIERGEIDLFEEYFYVPTLMSEVISIMAVQAGEKGLAFDVDYKAVEDFEYFGDCNRIRQILFNLIGNAIKFTKEGSVTVKSEIEAGPDDMEILSFAIQDTGIGIDGNMLDVVFNEFKQADSSVSREFGGTGLGLPISKRLAQIMGGDISVTSEKGKGSTFTLKLPLIDRKQINRDDGKGELRQKLHDKLATAIRHEQRALIVEDYEGNLVIVTYMLDEVGLAYDVARNGQEAVDLWKTKHYDIVLMDVQMPIMDGLTATQKIRTMEDENNFPATPIIGMTAHALVGDKNKCIEAGMSDYMPKPINSEEFKQKILKYIESTNGVAHKKTGT